MRIRAIVCRQCGAPLDPPVDHVLTECEFCGHQFEPDVRIGPSTSRSTTLGRAGAPCQREREIEAALDDLDREWESRRGGFLLRKPDAHYDVPVPERCLMVALLIAVVGLPMGGGLLWLSFADQLAMFVIAGSLLLVAARLYQAQRGVVYRRRLARYRDARHELLQRLDTAHHPLREESPV